MKQRYHNSPKEVMQMSTAELRENFLLESLMQPGTLQLTYSHYDRMIIGGVMPAGQAVALANYENLKAEFFLERRELGVINVGGPGSIEVDGQAHRLAKLDCLYVGRSSREVIFKSDDATRPAQYYLLSTPAHHDYPTAFMPK
jgi:4-deoxy-L-threo-5-hexosulose-uronate ketol-isomerase